MKPIAMLDVSEQGRIKIVDSNGEYVTYVSTMDMSKEEVLSFFKDFHKAIKSDKDMCKFLKNISDDIVEISPCGDYAKLCEKYGAESVPYVSEYVKQMKEAVSEL